MISFQRTAGTADAADGSLASEVADQGPQPPRRLTLTIPRSAQMVTQARHWFRDALSGWDQDRAAEAESLFSEVATNAVRHGRGQVTITVRLASEAVRCDVRDQSWRAPGRTCGHDLDLEDGRGIAIVTALAHAWGVRRRLRGKTVWFEILASGRNVSPL